MQYKHTSKTLPQLATCLSWWVSSHRCCFLFNHLPAPPALHLLMSCCCSFSCHCSCWETKTTKKSLQWAYSANHLMTVLPYGSSCEIKKQSTGCYDSNGWNVNATVPMCQYKTMKSEASQVLCNRMALNSRKFTQRKSSFFVCFCTAEIVAQHFLSFWLIGVEKWCSISNGAVNHVKCIHITFLPD